MHQASIAVVYHSETGFTQSLAKQVVMGANEIEDIHAFTLQISGDDLIHGRLPSDNLQLLSSVDAIVFGSPTYMGSVSAQFKAFADASSEIWSLKSWRNKLATGFTVGGSMSGEQQVTLQYFQTLALQHGMLWLGMDAHRDEYHPRFGQLNRVGASAGLIAYTSNDKLDAIDLNSARYLGYRVASLLNTRSNLSQSNAYFS
jgi:NAD(P)H dehydrogenase (quinone)